MVVLKFNEEAFFKDYCEWMCEAADKCMETFLTDVRKRAKPQHQNDFSIDKAQVIKQGEMIESTVTAYAYAVMDSWGRGRFASKANPYFEDYASSGLWNPLRNPAKPEIVGRKKGMYTNIFGEQAYSKGEHEGEITTVGHATGRAKPTYAIQNAEKGLKGGKKYVIRILDEYTEKFLEHSDEYFYNITV